MSRTITLEYLALTMAMLSPPAPGFPDFCIGSLDEIERLVRAVSSLDAALGRGASAPG